MYRTVYTSLELWVSIYFVLAEILITLSCGVARVGDKDVDVRVSVTKDVGV